MYGLIGLEEMGVEHAWQSEWLRQTGKLNRRRRNAELNRLTLSGVAGDRL